MEAPMSAIILAGGQSRRMGRPKAMLELGGTTILARIVSELAKACEEIVVVTAPLAVQSFLIEEALGATSAMVRIVRDETAYAGAAIALVKGLRAVRNQVAFVCSCDVPLVRAATARALCQILDRHDAVVPEIQGNPQPLCAVYRKRVAEPMSREIDKGERRLTAIAASLNSSRPGESELSAIDPGLRSFLNVNTPDDYARALRLAAERHL
jgi:molybdenum cofactor guanylyltransferase